MTVTIINTGPQLSEAEVAALEEPLGQVLPAPYRAFLLKFNGGKPRPNFFAVPEWPPRVSLVNDFHGVLPGRYNDLAENFELLEDRLPRGFIPIADDPGGNCVLLSLEGPTRGKVYFWDHENEPENPTPDLRDYPNIYWLADDFDEFLNSLQEEKDLL